MKVVMPIIFLRVVFVLVPFLFESNNDFVFWNDLPLILIHYYISIIGAGVVVFCKYRKEKNKHLIKVLLAIILLLVADIINTLTVNISNRMQMISLKMSDICYTGFMFFIFFYLRQECKNELNKLGVLVAFLTLAIGYFICAEIFIHKYIPEYVPGLITVNTARLYTVFEALVFAIATIQSVRETRFSRLLVLQALVLLCIADFGIRYNVVVQPIVQVWPSFERLWMFSWSIIFISCYHGLSLNSRLVRSIVTLRSMLVLVMFVSIAVWWIIMIKIGMAFIPTASQLTKAMLVIYLIWCSINVATETQLEVFQKIDFLLSQQRILGKQQLNSILRYIDDKIKVFGKI
jgi:hypothetical protein